MIRPRFRLITLFALMMVVAVVAAAYGTYQRSAQAEHRALTKISNQGAFIYVYGDISYRSGHIEFPQPNTPRGLLCGTGLVAVYSPSGSPAEFSDDDLSLFDDVHTKFSINFQGTRVSAAAVEKLKQRHPQFNVKI